MKLALALCVFAAVAIALNDGFLYKRNVSCELEFSKLKLKELRVISNFKGRRLDRAAYKLNLLLVLLMRNNILVSIRIRKISRQKFVCILHKSFEINKIHKLDIRISSLELLLKFSCVPASIYRT